MSLLTPHKNSSGYNTMVAAMVAATLQDLDQPVTILDDPLPKNGDESEYVQWIQRHTIMQRKKPSENASPANFLGDALYNHYTALSILNGESFSAMGHTLTLNEALTHLGLNDPESLIAQWKSHPEIAVETGNRLMSFINDSTYRGESGIPESILDNETENFVEFPNEPELTEKSNAMHHPMD